MSLPEVTDVQRLQLRPRDALVLYLNADRVSPEEADLVKERVRAVLDVGAEVPVIVLPAGYRVEVVSADMSAGVPAACEGRAPAGAPVPGSPVNPAREVC